VTLIGRRLWVQETIGVDLYELTSVDTLRILLSLEMQIHFIHLSFIVSYGMAF
jgi:hypothetical protein